MEFKGRKRQLSAINDDIYRFKILLPNGMTVGLILLNPGDEMCLEDFIRLVKEEYPRVLRLSTPKREIPMNWNAGNVYLEDAYDNKIKHRIKFANFGPHKCHILKFHDGSSMCTDTYENMWDLTPDTELLREFPEEYTFETALADLIDNSLQAVWGNAENDRRLISVNIMEDELSIFDTGPGMDNSDEHSIVKWGKMGASLHRSYKKQAIGGKPPYLMPYFGMFGYGGPIASMHLGRRALVSSKTKDSGKVYTLLLEREALLSTSRSELTWRTKGGMRNPSKDEIGESPQGSFTKVQIFGLKMKNLDIHQLQCRLKDIYFPYIQYDDPYNKGKTMTPIKFQVNSVDLAEIEGGEVSITNLHSCNGPEFTFQLHFSVTRDNVEKNQGSRNPQEANACLKCVYFPIIEGKESIEKISEKLKAEGCKITENFETFCRVSIRRLGRLLPDARWASLPFMESKQKKGDKAQLMKRCHSRVKCYIETDAGFNPTPSKTNLAHHNVFTSALKNFGSKISETEKEVQIEISRFGKQLNPSQLEKEYQEWIVKMHEAHDIEVCSGEDDPVLIVNPTNKKALGISSEVVRLHEALERKGKSWRSGQKIKVLKGACYGLYKKNVYATIEYFLIEGFEGDAGGEARIICRPFDVAEEDGCLLEVNNGNGSLDIRKSKSLPINVIDSGKCLPIGSVEWEAQLEKQHLKAPPTIGLLGAEECLELAIHGALPIEATVDAGHVPPCEIVAVVRPGSYTGSCMSSSLNQKYIMTNMPEISMEINFTRDVKGCRSVGHLYSKRVASCCRRGFNGLYIFKLTEKIGRLFQDAGVYTFVFSLVGSDCKDLERKITVRASSEVGKWRVLGNDKSQPYIVRVGSSFPPLAIECLDKYDNRIPFASLPEVTVELNSCSVVLAHIDKVKTALTPDKLTLELQDLVINSNQLDKLQPTYEANLLICQREELVSPSLSLPCKVFPGSLNRVKVEPPLREEQMAPGFVVKDLILQMFDAYGNHVIESLEVQLNVDGFQILDHIGLNRKVDNNGCIDLSRLLKVTAGFGKTVSLGISSDNTAVFKQEFQTGIRELRIASKVPEYLTAGSQLENVVFQVVNSDGDVDKEINDEGNWGQSHTLTIKSDSFNSDDCVPYAFRHGTCTVPIIPLPSIVGDVFLNAAHSSYPELHRSFRVSIIQNPSYELDAIQYQSPCRDRNIFFQGSTSPTSAENSPSLHDAGSPRLSTLKLEKNLRSSDILLHDSTSTKGNSPSLHNAGSPMLSIVKNEKRLEGKIHKYGKQIGHFEENLKLLDVMKAEREQGLCDLQASINTQLILSRKEDIMDQIECRSHSAAAITCQLSRNTLFQEPMSQLMEDIIGVVAMLGTVHSTKLSRVLGEYLGEDLMLGLVCSSYETASAIEKYKENGEVDPMLAFHGQAAALGKSIAGRFLVICLEELRAYTVKTEKSDPQRKLALADPKLPGGKIPKGFIGYAVNMIDIPISHLDIKTRAGYGLRETLFYSLFGKLQVYETREDMMKARSCMKHGAVSLDGGILKETGILSLGYTKNPEICFPVEIPDSMDVSPIRVIMKDVEKMEEQLQEITIQKEMCIRRREKTLKKFRKQQEQYQKLFDDCNINT